MSGAATPPKKVAGIRWRRRDRKVQQVAERARLNQASAAARNATFAANLIDRAGIGPECWQDVLSAIELARQPAGHAQASQDSETDTDMPSGGPLGVCPDKQPDIAGCSRSGTVVLQAAAACQPDFAISDTDTAPEITSYSSIRHKGDFRRL
jgi:hypothetical protein